MNNKIFVSLFLILFASSFANAQLRHVKGIKAIEVNYGYTKLGNYINLGYSKQVLQQLYLKGTLGFEKGEYKIAKFNSYIIDFGAFYSPVNLKKAIFLNFSGGITTNMDTYSNFEPINNAINFNYGAFVGAELEVYVLDSFVLLLNSQQKFLFNPTVGTKVYFLGAGIKYIL